MLHIVKYSQSPKDILGQTSNEFKVIYAQSFALHKINRPLVHPKLVAAIRIALAHAWGVAVEGVVGVSIVMKPVDKEVMPVVRSTCMKITTAPL